MPDPGLEEVRAELREQRRLLDETHAMVRSMRRSLRITHILHALKWAVILVVIVVAVIYLLPIVQHWIETVQQYQSYLPGQGTTSGQSIDFKQIQEYLQKSGMYQQ
jgi:hypothetical protein